MKITDAIKGYLLSRKAKCNEKTIEWYRQKLSHLCLTLQQEYEITLLNKVTVTHLRLFVEHMKETKAGQNHPFKPLQDDATIRDVTVKGYVQAIKGFFNWCVKEELLKKNPALNLDNPKVARYVIRTYSEDQIKAMFDASDTNMVLSLRDRVIILLLLDTGIRVSEMCSLTIDRVFLAVTNEAFIKVMGKGRKEREVGLSPNTAQLLWKYIHMYRHPAKTDDQTLFINVYGEPLTMFGVEQMLSSLGRKANITGVRVSPHTFRHTFARMFLENGGNIYKLSLLLGHSSVMVTENYLKDFESRIARQDQNKHSPVANMDLGKKKGGFRKGLSDILGN